MKVFKYKVVRSAKRGAGVASLFGLLSAVAGVGAEGMILETTGEVTPITASRTIEPTAENAWVRFDFGLATIEDALAGTFQDSVTVTLQGNTPASTAIIATLDRSGVVFAPANPGGLTLEPTSVQWTSVEFPNEIAPGLPHRAAYTVTALVPAELTGADVTFFVDLFDNKNGLNSVAYVTEPTVIPEPAALYLGFVGVLLVAGFKWRRS